MLDRGPRDARPFGTRRPDPRPDLAAPGPAEIPGWDAPGRPPGPLPWALRTAALIGFGAVLVTQYLARPGEAPALRVALAPVAGAALDPDTTGSIGARAARLDPCALAAPARPRP